MFVACGSGDGFLCQMNSSIDPLLVLKRFDLRALLNSLRKTLLPGVVTGTTSLDSGFFAGVESNTFSCEDWINCGVLTLIITGKDFVSTDSPCVVNNSRCNDSGAPFSIPVCFGAWS